MCFKFTIFSKYLGENKISGNCWPKFESRCSFRGCSTDKTRLDSMFLLTFFIVINVTWLKRPTYEKRITLIYKLFPEILEVTNEGSEQGKSQILAESGLVQLLDHISVVYWKQNRHTYKVRIIQNAGTDCRIRNQAGEFSSWTE